MVKVNGIELDIAGKTLAEYLETTNYELKRIAVECNGEIVFKANYGTTILKDDENPEDYVFILNGVEYQCNDFLKGTTKFKASYKTNGHDTIMLEYIIDTGLANIKIRTDDDFEVLDSNSFEFKEFVPDTEKPKVAIVRFSEDIAGRVTFESGEWKVEGVE